MLELGGTVDLSKITATVGDNLARTLEKHGRPSAWESVIEKYERDLKAYGQLVDPYRGYLGLASNYEDSAFHKMQAQCMREAQGLFAMQDELERTKRAVLGYATEPNYATDLASSQLASLGSTIANTFGSALDGTISAGRFTETITQAAERAALMRTSALEAGSIVGHVVAEAERQRQQLAAMYSVANDPLQRLMKDTIGDTMNWQAKFGDMAAAAFNIGDVPNYFADHTGVVSARIPFEPAQRPATRTEPETGSRTEHIPARPLTISPTTPIGALYDALRTLCPRVESATRNALHTLLSQRTPHGANWITASGFFSNRKVRKIQAYAKGWAKKGNPVELHDCLDITDVISLLENPDVWVHASDLFSAAQSAVIAKLEEFKGARDQSLHDIPGLTIDVVVVALDTAEEIASELGNDDLSDAVKEKRKELAPKQARTLH